MLVLTWKVHPSWLSRREGAIHTDRRKVIIHLRQLRTL